MNVRTEIEVKDIPEDAKRCNCGSGLISVRIVALPFITFDYCTNCHRVHSTQ